MTELRRLRRLISIGAIGLCAAGSLALGMDASWDLRNYHFYNGYAVWHGLLDFHVLAAQRPSFFNPLLDVGFYLIVSQLPAMVAGAVLGAIHGLNFPLLLSIALRFAPGPDPRAKLAWASLAALIGMTGAMTLGILGLSFHDNVTSLGFLASLAMLLRGLLDLHAGRAWRWALLCGIPAGLAAGAKQPAAVYALSLCFAMLCVGSGWRVRLTNAFFSGLGVALAFALTSGPWMFYLWDNYGNPLMPFFNELFRSPMAELKDYRDVQFVPKDIVSALLFPLRILANPRLTAEVPFLDPRLAAAMVAWLGYGAWRMTGHGQNSAAADAVMVATGMGYTLWLAGFAIYRYAVVLEMLAPVLLVIAARPLPLSTARVGLLAAFGLILALTRPAHWDRAPWQAGYVGVSAPSLPGGSMVLMTGYEATSYVIPFFRKDTRFVRIMSNYTHPFETANGFNPRMRVLVDAHRGPLYSLFVGWEEWHNNQGLEIYGLKWRRETCAELTGTIMVAPILLCPIERSAAQRP